MQSGISGIYEIVNKVNGKRYIGSSVNVRKRLQTHINFLTNNKHENSKLQRAWNKYGQESFTFDVIHYCEIDQLLICEQWMIDQYNFKEELYNISLKVQNAMEGRFHTKETKDKISKSKTGKPLTFINKEEKDRKIGISNRGNNAKLSIDDIRHIKMLDNHIPQHIIATLFGVGQPHISKIINGKRWEYLY